MNDRQQEKKTFKEQASNAAKILGDTASQQAQVISGTAATHARLVASDIITALKTDRKAQMLMAITLVALVCWDLPYISMLLYPLKMFVTIIHEMCHALATRITGGQVTEIDLFINRGGVTATRGGWDYLVWPAGYVGTAIFGGLLMWWGRNPAGARLVLHTIGVVIIALTIFYIGGGAFSFVMAAAIGAGLVLIAKKASERFCHFFLLMLAVVTTLEGLTDIQVLFIASVATDMHSDARGMEGLTGIPAVFWAIAWGLLSVCILVFSFWISYRPQKQDEALQPFSSSPAAAVDEPEPTAVG